MGDIGHAIGRDARRAGFGILADHGGHGIGRAMHEEPHVPNDGLPGRGIWLSEGLVIAIEPIISAGSGDEKHANDKWTISTADGSLSAHYEHTVVITRAEPILLTVA
jgi:methionyl aminopeptidase